MSMSGISFLTEQQQDIRSPEFAKVLKGFDPMEVEAYVYQVVQHIEALEKEIERLQSQRDAAEDHYNSVVEDAYQQVAGRMGEVIRAADHYVEKLRVDSEADAKRRVAEASRQAEGIRKDAENDAAQIRAEAQADAERMREDGQQELAEARAEVDRILGGLVLRRDEMLGEFADIRQKVLDVVGRIDVATAAAKSRRGVPVTTVARPQASPKPAHPAATSSRAPETSGSAQQALITPPTPEPARPVKGFVPDRLEPSIAGDDDDLLTLPHGFDLVLGGLFDEDDDDASKGGNGRG